MTEQMGDVTDHVAAAGSSQGEKEQLQEVPPPADIDLDMFDVLSSAGNARIEHVGKSQSCMVWYRQMQ